MTCDTLITSAVCLNSFPTTKKRHNFNTHKRSQSYNIEFSLNKTNKFQVNINYPINKPEQAPTPSVTNLEEPPLIQIFFTYFCYTVLRWFGNLREFLRSTGFEKRKAAKDNNPPGFQPLFSSFENFFTQNFYMRGRDCFNRPISGVPGAEIELIERKTEDFNWTFKETGRKFKALNMGSYNYLGFAENSGKTSESVQSQIRSSGVATCSPRQELGTVRLQLQLESMIARFLNKPSALTFGMGFAVNAVNIPALVDKTCLIMSDELNHTSLILGSRLSGALVKTFKHNNPHDLETKLRAAIIQGQPKTGRAWKKILIIVEGIYSMEGTILNLPAIDEAHSIGALGQTGRGVCEHWGINVRDIDVMMGTFSKSFGAAGGYIAGSAELIRYLRIKSHAQCYASSMSPPVCQQIISTLSIIMGLDGGNDGRERIARLTDNSIYFRDKIAKMGFIVYGDKGSPIVPVMFYLPTKCLYFNRLMLEMGVAVVSVGFPATSLIGGRVRFCVSAAHTREMLDKVLDAIDFCGGYVCNSKISRINRPRTMSEIKKLEEKKT